jgi:hypothetical protein
MLTFGMGLVIGFFGAFVLLLFFVRIAAVLDLPPDGDRIENGKND